jgi:hypothetical protein
MPGCTVIAGQAVLPAIRGWARAQQHPHPTASAGSMEQAQEPAPPAPATHTYHMPLPRHGHLGWARTVCTAPLWTVCTAPLWTVCTAPLWPPPFMRRLPCRPCCTADHHHGDGCQGGLRAAHPPAPRTSRRAAPMLCAVSAVPAPACSASSRRLHSELGWSPAPLLTAALLCLGGLLLSGTMRLLRPLPAGHPARQAQHTQQVFLSKWRAAAAA